jgi:hypothetical protein
MNLMIHEILEKAAAEPKRDGKIATLKKHNCLALRDVLRAAYDDSIVFTLPEGAPPYENKLSTDGNAAATLHSLTTRFTYFVKGGKGDKIPAIKRERIFLEIVEGVHPKEAELVIAMKDKKMASRYKGITKELVKEVWPKLIAQ